MPNDAPVWDETVAVPTWDETHAPKAPTSYPMGGTFAPTPEQMAAAKETIRGGDVKYDESFVNIPPLSGEEITATTGLPKAVTIPAAAAANLPIGIVNYFGSPQGVTEAAAALTPAAPLVGLKWAKDMIVGAGETIKDLAQRKLYEKMQQAVGVTPTEPVTAQELANAAVAVPAMLMGGAGAGLGSARAIRQTLPARPVVPPRVNRPDGLPAEEGAQVLPGGMPPPEHAAIPKPLEIVRPTGPTAAELMAQEAASQPQFVTPTGIAAPSVMPGEVIKPPPGVVVTPRPEPVKPKPETPIEEAKKEVPVEESAPGKAKPNPVRDIATKLDTETDYTIGDAVEELQTLDKLPKDVRAALNRYIKDREVDRREYGDRSGLTEEAGDALESVLAKYAAGETPKPTEAIEPSAKIDVSAVLNAPNKSEAQRIGGSLIIQAKTAGEIAQVKEALLNYKEPITPGQGVGPRTQTTPAAAPTSLPATAPAPVSFKGLDKPISLSPEDAADVRMHEPGITYKSRPNQIVIDLRDLESRPVRKVYIKPTGDVITDAANVVRRIEKEANNDTRLSLRESAGTLTNGKGLGVRRYAASPNGPVWTDVDKLIEARKQIKQTPAQSPVEPPPAPAPTPAEVVKQPWEMSDVEFMQAAKRGKIHKATGKETPGKPTEADTPISIGEREGYSADDIARFYVQRRGGFRKDIPDSVWFDAIQNAREELVRDAISEGKPVPAEVLADYPELKANATTTEPKAKPQTPGGATLSETTARQYVLNKIRTDDPEFVGSTLYSKHIGTTKDGKNVVNVFLLDGIGGPIKSQEHVLVSQDGKVVVSPETKPTPEPPAKAVEKVKEQVATVARTEGQPSAKAVKTELVKRLESALEEANRLENAGKSPEKPVLKINIPGDGDFTVVNSPYSIGTVLKEAKRISTSSTEMQKAPVVSSGDITTQAKKIIEAYGSAEAAYKSARRQRDALPDNDPDTRAQVERADLLIDELYKWTKAGVAEVDVDKLTTIVRSFEDGSESFREGIAKIQKIKRPSASRKAELLDLQERYALNQKKLAEYKAQLAITEQTAAREKMALEAEFTKPTPQPVSMGGLNPNDPLERPSQMMPTANKNASIDADRIARGEQPMMKAMRRTDPELWDMAMAEINKDWGAADNIIADLKQNPRVPSDLELMILLHRRVDLKNEFAKASRDMALATEEGRTADAQAGRAQRDMFLEKLQDLESMLGRGDYAAGTMAGRALRARRLMMNEDFSLASLIVDRQASLGRKLTATETAELEKIAAEYKAKADKLDARVVELERQAEEVQAQHIAEQAKRDAEQVKIHPSVLEYAEKFVSAMEKKADRYAKDLMGATWSPTPETLGKAAYIGAARLARGIVEMAKWTDEMVAVLGEKFRPYADEVRKKSEELLKSELTEVEKIPNAPKIREVIITGKVEKASPEAIIKRLSERVKKAPKEMPDLQPMARKLAAYFYQQGIHEPMKIVDAVHAEFQRVFPNLERRETMDALSGYGRFSPLSKDALKVALRDVYGQLQQIGKLEDMAKGQAPLRTGPERRVPTDAERALIKQVEEAKRKGGYKVTDPAAQLRTALQAAQRRMENQIADLTKEIETRQKIVKTKTKLVYDEKLTALKAKLDQLREIHREVFKAAPLTEAQRLALWKERVKERIADLKERYYMADFKPRPKPIQPRLDKEAIQLRYELHKIHNALLDLKLKDQLAKRTQGRKLWDNFTNLIRFSRAAMTGGEFSGVLRQGGFVGASHPILAAKALSPMFRALMSEKNQFAINEEIHTRPNAPLYERSKLDFTESGVRLSTMEEHYQFRVSEKLAKIWGIKHGVAFLNAFQRAYTTFLNRLRADAFDKMVDTYGDDPVMTKQIANFINVATGRGSTGLGKWVGPGANAVFFAPRYSISRFQLLLGQPAWSGNAQTRKMVVKEYGRALAGAATVYTLGVLAGGTLEEDPRSADFGKIKFGNTRIDPLAGLAQVTRLLAEEASGTRVNQKGKVVPIRGDKVPYGQPSGWDVAAQFARQKLSPAVGAAASFATGKDPTGMLFKLSDAMIQGFTPITYGDVLKAMQEQGVPLGTAMAVLAIFGMGVQTYEPRQPKTKSGFSLSLGGL